MEKPINERALQILRAIVERYIRDGQPVGSKAIAEDTAQAMALSSATIRHIMADLEMAGYLHSPHTSAGRVPTVQGYRLFVNSLLTTQPLETNQWQQLQAQLQVDQGSNALVEQASTMLSNLTRLAGLVTLPKRERVALRQVEFLPLSQHRVLTILVFSDREIQNRIIDIAHPFTASQLQTAGNYLTQTFAGKTLAEIRQALIHAMQQDREHMQSIMHDMTEIIGKIFSDTLKEDYILAGESNLISLAEEAGLNRLRNLFEALNQKRDILHLLDQCLHSDGVQIFIGQESGYEALDEYSLVTAPYARNGQMVGVLGVIGPTRMPYEQVINTVDITAKLLSAALSRDGF
jgi:heat-inducible transcriptional repressor